MPSIKDFEKKNKQKATPVGNSGDDRGAGAQADSTDQVVSEKQNAGQGSKRPQRRPGREQGEAPASAGESLDELKVVDVETGVTMNETMNEVASEMTNENKNESTAAPEERGTASEQKPENHVEIKFPGSEILRAKFAKPFEVAETIATDWMNDGKFEGLPLGHPLAQYFAAKGLQKAKQMEKKVLESPVTEKVALQALQVGMKAQEIISQVRAKVKK